jgi:phage-related protein
LKPVEFLGDSLKDLRRFPDDARRQAGQQLDRIQRGLEPVDWKPMSTIGRSVREIRIQGADGAFRVVYIANFASAVYVLHCFQKRSQRTSKLDLDLASRRFKLLAGEN